MSNSLGARRALRRLFAFFDIGRGPDRVEGLVEPEARIDVARKFIRLCDDCFERCTNECVAVGLASRQRARIATEERQVGGEFLAKGHKNELSVELKNLRRQ
jgi:hypothetical protein